MAEQRFISNGWRGELGLLMGEECTVIKDARNEVVGFIYDGTPEGKRNASRAIAAPELLEALRVARVWLESHPEKPANSLNQIKQAIAKAEGRL